MPKKPRASTVGVEAGIIHRGNIRQSIQMYQSKGAQPPIFYLLWM